MHVINVQNTKMSTKQENVFLFIIESQKNTTLSIILFYILYILDFNRIALHKYRRAIIHTYFHLCHYQHGLFVSTFFPLL